MSPGARDVGVRRARPDDAAGLAAAHVAAWRAAYRGLMPQDHLDGLDIDRWTSGWERSLAAQRPGADLLAATVDGILAGFTSFGPSRDADSGDDGELYALNVHPDHWSRGVGSALLDAARTGLVELGHEHANLWVVPGNLRARGFYERHGWVGEQIERTAEINGVTVAEVRYRLSLRSV